MNRRKTRPFDGGTTVPQRLRCGTCFGFGNRKHEFHGEPVCELAFRESEPPCARTIRSASASPKPCSSSPYDPAALRAVRERARRASRAASSSRVTPAQMSSAMQMTAQFASLFKSASDTRMRQPASLCSRALARAFSTTRVSKRSSPRTVASAARSSTCRSTGCVVELGVHVRGDDGAQKHRKAHVLQVERLGGVVQKRCGVEVGDQVLILRPCARMMRALARASSGASSSCAMPSAYPRIIESGVRMSCDAPRIRIRPRGVFFCSMSADVSVICRPIPRSP